MHRAVLDEEETLHTFGAALAQPKAFDPDEPRDEGGKWTDGGGSDGGDGGSSTGSSSESKPSSDTGGGKKKADIADFAKDHVLIDSELRTNPDKQQKFLEKWNTHIGEAPSEFKKDFLGGLPASMAIRYDDVTDAMTVSGAIKDANDDPIGDYTRSIDLGTHTAYSTYFKLHDSSTGKDVGKTVLKSNVAMYQKMGVERVEVHANIDVGGYAWAKYGYVPNQRDWSNLVNELDEKIDTMSGPAYGGGHGESWDELSSGTQKQIETAFYNQTNAEFYDSEENNWRDNGGPLEAAKEGLAFKYQENRGRDWADHAIDGVQKDLADHGKPVIPFSNEQLLNAISVEYSGDGEGTGALEVTFDDEKLDQPQGVDPSQPTLPGIAAVAPHEHLTDDMRDRLDTALQETFANQAKENSDSISPPNHLDEIAVETQRDYWESLDDSDKYDWAKRNEPDLIGPAGGGGDMSEEDANRLRTLIGNGDPKAIWAVADSKYGRELLLGTDWNGALDLRDKETMDRFNAYVGKTSKAA